MPEKEDKTADYPVGPDGKKLKPCCVCPETKVPRDECIMEKVNRWEEIFFVVLLIKVVFYMNCREKRTVET